MCVCVCMTSSSFSLCVSLSIPRHHDNSPRCPLNPTPLTLRLPSWAGPPQDRQLFDTISLLIQGSLEGELKLMDELAGPGGQPSAFPPARSPGGSDPQVTVSPVLCRAVPCCAVLRGRWGCFLPTGWLEKEQPQGLS